MKILINGNLGYIGPIVAAHFRQTFPASRLIGHDIGYFAGCLMDAKCFPETTLDVQYYGDVRCLRPEVLEGVDAVIQLAAISNDPMGVAFEKVTAAVNADAVYANAEHAKAAGVKAFAFASSCSVYGAGGDDAKSEMSALNPLTAYARSKIAAEERLASLASADFKVTSLRFATACGFSPRLRLDLVLNDFVASAVTSGQITILSDGTPWRPLIHVKDMARALEWAIVRPIREGGDNLVVNVGSDKWNYQVRELAEGVRDQLGDVKVSINKAAQPDKRSYRVDFSLFAKLAPQHQPCQTLQTAVAGLANGLRRFSNGDFRNSDFIRLKVLNDLRNGGQLTDQLTWTAQ